MEETKKEVGREDKKKEKAEEGKDKEKEEEKEREKLNVEEKKEVGEEGKTKKKEVVERGRQRGDKGGSEQTTSTPQQQLLSTQQISEPFRKEQQQQQQQPQLKTFQNSYSVRRFSTQEISGNLLNSTPPSNAPSTRHSITHFTPQTQFIFHSNPSSNFHSVFQSNIQSSSQPTSHLLPPLLNPPHLDPPHFNTTFFPHLTPNLRRLSVRRLSTSTHRRPSVAFSFRTDQSFLSH